MASSLAEKQCIYLHHCPPINFAQKPHRDSLAAKDIPVCDWPGVCIVHYPSINRRLFLSRAAVRGLLAEFDPGKILQIRGGAELAVPGIGQVKSLQVCLVVLADARPVLSRL